MKPLSNYVLIEPIEVPDTTPSGLLLPEASKDRPNQGKVVAVGDGQMYDGKIISVSVKVGDVVLFPRYSGTEMKLKDKKYLIMRDTDLFGILSE
jgi:chaperonin GroES